MWGDTVSQTGRVSFEAGNPQGRELMGEQAHDDLVNGLMLALWGASALPEYRIRRL